ncbi:uncharacterized protein LOC116290325 [Actinia tenebrosa]|uniref:Uncharacterized protein LOC116290325 n=1 Tax=Actinia tenebrosa TaxID=6105 RepID=A0A6P8HKG8_ACTTE|nr:uncharacterized protein LOC116290325 [Actinia tenebrosa]
MMKVLVIWLILAVLLLATESREYKHHLILKSNVFDVYWSVNTTDPIFPRFYFKFVAKTTGWAALGWSQTASGRHMQQYDIALGGVRNGNESYIGDYYSSTPGKPDHDGPSLQSLVLTNATEADGYTTIEFNRAANTLDTATDVPLKNGTKIWLMWAIASTDAIGPSPAPTNFVKHSDRNYTRFAYNMYTGERFEDSSSTSVPSSSATAKPSDTTTSDSRNTGEPGSSTTAKPINNTGTTEPSVAITNIPSLTVVIVLLQLGTLLM